MTIATRAPGPGTGMATAADDWIDSLSRSPLFRGAELRHDDRGVEVSRGSARALLWPSAACVDPEIMVQALAGGDAGLLLIGAAPPWLTLVPLDRAPIALLPEPAPAEALCLAVHGVLERAELRRNATERIRELSRYRYERGELVEIARAIARERDCDRLLSSILEKSRYVTGADAGSVYVVEGDATDPAGYTLRFKLSQNDSMSYESSEFTVPISNASIAGAAVLARTTINIADVYEMGVDVPYAFDPSFDRRTGYRTRSMLAVPMISAEDEVIGVIQLINKKRNLRDKLRAPEDFKYGVLPFDARSAELAAALAAQAGIALENALLYQEIRDIFEGFVRASVQAIEQRDPTTSGHSQRVSVLSCRLAEQVDRAPSGVYREAHFDRRDLQELKYAALLHDFGKIGIREQVLTKAKKLYPYERAAIRARIELALGAAEVELLSGKLALHTQSRAGAAELADCERRYHARREQLLQAWAVIERADEPTVLSEGDFSRIAEVGAISFAGASGEARTLLSEAEAAALAVTRGSLSPAELAEIRSHVVHTYAFLTKIPWGRSMQGIPEIARAHHEKLDGSGYPLGMRAPEIPLQSKIMAVADIYDALTASDRPYKKALAAERALQILQSEVDDGRLDAELVRMFREARVYEMADGRLDY